MPLDPTAQNVGVGGMLFLSALWLLLKYKPWKNGNGKSANKAGDASTEEWIGRMTALHEASNAKLLADIKSLLDSRNDKLRAIIRDELGRGVHE
jgi:hypothetical protein